MFPRPPGITVRKLGVVDWSTSRVDKSTACRTGVGTARGCIGMDDGGFIAQGTPVHVLAGAGRFPAQVMFRHAGDPNRYLVAWLYDAPPDKHPIADWVDASQVALPHDEAGAGGGGMAQRQDR